MTDADVIKQSVRLSDVIERYGVKLKRLGRDAMIGKCPVHREKDPSFRVYDDGHFHCYGCQWNGDVISFIQVIEAVEFKEAIEILVRDFGADNTASEEYRQIKAKQKLVYDWYAGQLAALEDLAFAYEILCRELEQSGDVDNYMGAASELARIEGCCEEDEGLIGEVRGLGRQGAVLVALYDSNGPKSKLPPIQAAQSTLRYADSALLAYLQSLKVSIDRHRTDAILFLTDFRNTTFIPAADGSKMVKQVTGDSAKASKVIDGYVRKHSNPNPRPRRETGNPRVYPSRRGSGGGHYSQPAA